MKRLLILFFFIPLFGLAQTAPPIVQGSKYYEFRNSVRIDSALFLPRRDTFIYDVTLRAPSMLTGRPQDSLLYYYTGSKWLKLLSDIDTTSLSARINSKVDSSRWLDSLEKKVEWYSIIDPLLAEEAVPIQPTDSLIVALGKLQSQINYWQGSFVDNQDAVDQTASFRIAGTGTIRAEDNALSIVRAGSGLGHRGLIYFKDDAGTTVGDIGLGESISRDYMYFSNVRAGQFHTVHDTSSIIWRTFNSIDGARALTSWHKGKLLISDTTFTTNYIYRDTADYPLEVRNTSGLSAKFWQGITADKLLAGTDASTYKMDIRGSSHLRFNGNALNMRPESSGTGNVWIQFNNTSDAAIGYAGFTSAANNNYAITNLVNGGHISFITNGGSAAERVRITATGNLLIGTTGDNGELLRVGGAISLPSNTVTGNTTLGSTQHVVRVNNTGSVTITLPAAASMQGRIYVIKKVSAASNDVIVDGNASETIDNSVNKTLTLQWSSITVQSNGTGWDIISSHANATTL